MRKDTFPIYDRISFILEKLKRGILLTTKHDGKVNTMSIGWGQIGIEWNRLFFVALVRKGRYTHEMLEKNGEFTINVPLHDDCNDIIGYCGSHSGRDTDKIKDLNLTLEDSLIVSVPGIVELPLTLECTVLYKQDQDLSLLPEHLRNQFYPQDKGSAESGSNQNLHTMFYGEIEKYYVLE